jgi:hypothetical protein
MKRAGCARTASYSARLSRKRVLQFRSAHPQRKTSAAPAPECSGCAPACSFSARNRAWCSAICSLVAFTEVAGTRLGSSCRCQGAAQGVSGDVPGSAAAQPVLVLNRPAGGCVRGGERRHLRLLDAMRDWERETGLQPTVSQCTRSASSSASPSGRGSVLEVGGDVRRHPPSPAPPTATGSIALRPWRPLGEVSPSVAPLTMCRALPFEQ